jgi:hypothetical protein
MVDSAIIFTPGEVSNYYAVRVPHLKRRGAEWRGACPIHKGDRDSFAVDSDTGQWTCHSACCRGGDILDLEEALTGADFKAAKADVFNIIGRQPTPNGNHSRGRIVGEYDYRDENRNLLYQVVRMDPKDFRQRRPDSNGWVWSLKGVRLVLYRLPELLKRPTETVFQCEGEKDVHSLESLGLLATCNPMGAGKWRAEYSEALRGRRVVILPDNDEPGRKHAAAVAADLLRVGCQVRIIELPGLSAKGDVSDWIASGGTVGHLRDLYRGHPALTKDSLVELRARWALAADEAPHQVRVEAGTLTTRRVSDIEMKPVSWLWPGRIARGKVSIIAGNPGLGKSQITASIAAIVTTGGCWPVDGSQCVAGDVVFLSAEDDPADTLRPRLEAAGADLRRVHVMDAVVAGYTGDGTAQLRAFSLERDLTALSAKLGELGDVAAVVIDPITAYLGEVDSHRNAEVRALLAPLSDLAAQHRVAIIGVSHLNKSAGPEALMRVTGSLAFVAAARAAYLVAADPEDKGRRFFLPMKNNIGPDSIGLAFRIEGTTVQSGAGPLQTSRVVWDTEPVTVTADDVMRPQATESSSAFREATDWLGDTLTEPTSAAEVMRLAVEAGISKATLRRASDALGVIKEKTGMKGGWTWTLPPKVLKESEDAQEKNVSTFGNLEHLREPDGMTMPSKMPKPAEDVQQNCLATFGHLGHLGEPGEMEEVEI